MDSSPFHPYTDFRAASGVEFACGDGREDTAHRAVAHIVTVSPNSATAPYHKQITGREGEAFMLNGVKCDGISGTGLVDAKGPGYAQFIKDGDWAPWYRGKDTLVSQAARQVDAAEGASIVWHVAEDKAVGPIQRLLQENGLSQILVMHTPAR